MDLRSAEYLAWWFKRPWHMRAVTFLSRCRNVSVCRLSVYNHIGGTTLHIAQKEASQNVGLRITHALSATEAEAHVSLNKGQGHTKIKVACAWIWIASPALAGLRCCAPLADTGSMSVEVIYCSGTLTAQLYAGSGNACRDVSCKSAV
jgi:hypothetical protein